MSSNEATVQEVREAQTRMENRIREAINEFEEEVGLLPSDVDINILETCTKDSSHRQSYVLGSVETTVDLSWKN